MMILMMMMSVVVGAELGRLRAERPIAFGVLGVTAVVARLGPRVYHFHLLYASTHHAVMRISVREDSFHGRASRVLPRERRLVRFVAGSWTLLAEVFVRIFLHELWLFVAIFKLVWGLSSSSFHGDDLGHLLLAEVILTWIGV